MPEDILYEVGPLAVYCAVVCVARPHVWMDFAERRRIFEVARGSLGRKGE